GCGSGPLRGFTGTDSRGNVLHTVSATVTNLADVIDGVTDETARLSAARAVEAQLDEAPPADESLEEAAAADTDDEVAVEAALGRRSRLRRRVARPGGGRRARWKRRRAVADASVDVHLATDEHDDVSVAAAPAADEPLEEAVAAVRDREIGAEAEPRGEVAEGGAVARAGGGLRARWARRRAVADASVDVHVATDEHDDVAVSEFEV